MRRPPTPLPSPKSSRNKLLLELFGEGKIEHIPPEKEPRDERRQKHEPEA